jgi:eukaryotic-like serine/threonine-protein kinase
MAKNRENRYRTPDDLILDLKCLIAGDSPMIAGQKLDTLATLAEGEGEERQLGATQEQLIEMAGYVNNRNGVIAALAMLLALSIVTNVVFFAVR